MIVDEPVRGGYPDPRTLGLTGYQQMELFLERGGPVPPISHLVGLRPNSFTEGTSEFEMPVTPWLSSSVGVVQGGIWLVLADAPLGTAVHTKLPKAVTYTTSEISMYFLRPVSIGVGGDKSGGKVVGRARAIHVGRSLALSEVALYDEQERLVAHGSSRLFVFPPIDPAPEPPDEYEPVPAPITDPPDPYLREEVLGAPLPQDVWERHSGLEVLRAQIAGELPPPPMSQLTGIRLVEADEGRVTMRMPASEWLASPTGMVQGGATAMLADAGLAAAVLTTLPPSTAFAPLDIKTNFLRPVPRDGRDLTVNARVLHRGKSLAVAEAEVLNADDKLVMFASGTSQILPGRPASLGS